MTKIDGGGRRKGKGDWRGRVEKGGMEGEVWGEGSHGKGGDLGREGVGVVEEAGREREGHGWER